MQAAIGQLDVNGTHVISQVPIFSACFPVRHGKERRQEASCCSLAGASA